MRALILAASLALPSLALATPESDYIAALESRLALVESRLAQLSPAPSRPSPASVAARGALLAARFPMFGLGGILPATISGGGGGTSDPIVPADGTQNITGAVTASGQVYAGGANGAVIGGAAPMTALAFPSNGNTGIAYSGATTAILAEYRSGITDSASAVAHRISTHNDLTTSGAKILSVGDNAGTSYAEKAYIDKDGNIAASSSGIFRGNASSVFLQNSGGTTYLAATTSGPVEFAPTATHGVKLTTSGTKATCAAGNRGSLFYQAGGAGVADTVFICSKSSGDVYAWRDLATPET